VPELPEVETIVRDLRPLLVGRRIVSVKRLTDVELRRRWDITWPELLSGRHIESIDRRGKWIVLRLDDGSFLVFHMGMTGQLTVVDEATPQPDHLHLVFSLDSRPKQLRFRDSRRFGSATRFANQAELDSLFAENELGPEPFDLDARAWRSNLADTKRPIKAVLTDQSVVAGVGNIYADEVLFAACVHPSRRACDLTREQAELVRTAIAEVLTAAIDKRGATIRDYVGGSGEEGGAQDEFRVYGRKGEPCPRCETIIAIVKIAGRSSHYCPRCQKAPRRKAAGKQPAQSRRGKKAGP
jgi:formamidopyrimidine-DNA glycosylase